MKKEVFIKRDVILDQPLYSYRSYGEVQNVFNSKDLAMLNSLGIQVFFYIDSETEVTIGLMKKLGINSESSHYFPFAESELKIEYTFNAKKVNIDKFILSDLASVDVFLDSRDCQYYKIVPNQIINKDGLRSKGINAFLEILRVFLEDYKNDIVSFFIGLSLINTEFSKIEIPAEVLYKTIEIPGLDISLVNSDDEQISVSKNDLVNLNIVEVKDNLNSAAMYIADEIRLNSQQFIVNNNYDIDLPTNTKYSVVKINIKSIKKSIPLIEIM